MGDLYIPMEFLPSNFKIDQFRYKKTKSGFVHLDLHFSKIILYAVVFGGICIDGNKIMK